MFASARGKQQKRVRHLQCQEQCIDHIPYYLSGMARALFFRQPFSKQLHTVVHICGQQMFSHFCISFCTFICLVLGSEN